MDPPPLAEPAIGQKSVDSSKTPVSKDHDARYGVPTLNELGR